LQFSFMHLSQAWQLGILREQFQRSNETISRWVPSFLTDISWPWTTSVTFEKCSISSPHIHFTLNMYVYLERTISYHLVFVISLNFGHTSKMPLALLMAAIFMLHLLHHNVLFTEIARVFCPKIAYSDVLLICSLCILW
jgi:hypothetical protein